MPKLTKIARQGIARFEASTQCLKTVAEVAMASVKNVIGPPLNIKLV